MGFRCWIKGEAQVKTGLVHLLLATACATLFLPTRCYADPVDIGVGGHLLGSSPIGPDQELYEGFTLYQDTEATSIQIAIYPVGDIGFLTGSFQVFLIGPGGDVYYEDEAYYPDGGVVYSYRTPLPIILPTGFYSLEFETGPCGNPCYGQVAAYDYYAPATYFDAGGTTGEGHIGFEIVGNTVPETSTWLLLGTGLAFIFLRRYKVQRLLHRPVAVN
jgi:hypothetical protein